MRSSRIFPYVVVCCVQFEIHQVKIDIFSIDFEKMEKQDGDEHIVPFSFETDQSKMENIVSCYVTYTNAQTHKVILDNLHRSPLYSGRIEGVGPRYCP